MTGSAGAVAEHFFRRETGRLVAALLRSLGPARLDLAETAVQEAFLAALRTWPLRGVPDRPDAWLLRVASRRAIDALRREARFDARVDAIAAEIEATAFADGGESAGPRFAGEIADDRLRLLFLCGHPALSRASRVALILRVASGFGNREIARAFRTTEATIAQRIVRAKRTLRDVDAAFRMPPPAELPTRLDAVLDALWLAFGEGCHPVAGEDPVRRDLVDESLRLVRVLDGHPAAAAAPAVAALRAHLLFQAARLDARVAPDGSLVPLEAQDRGLWDAALVAEGFAALERAARGSEMSDWHLLAGIDACHAAAESAETTDWERIAEAWEELARRGGGDLARLNRAVARSRARGPAHGLALVDALAGSAELAGGSALPAARADLLDRLGRRAEARAAWRDALAVALSPAERRYYETRGAE